MKRHLLAAALAGALSLTSTLPARAEVSPLGELLQEWSTRITIGRATGADGTGKVTPAFFQDQLWRIQNFAQEVIDMVVEGAGLTAEDVQTANALLSMHEGYLNYYAQFATDADSVVAIMEARAKLAEARGALMAYWEQVLGLKPEDMVREAQNMGRQEVYPPYMAE